MRGLSLPLNSLLTQAPDAPIYLDGAAWRSFIDWLAPRDTNDTVRLDYLTQGDWQVVLFRAQLNRAAGSDSSRDAQLKELGIEIVPARGRGQIRDDDEVFLEEAQRVYFANVPGARRQAELLLLARRHTDHHEGLVNIISQHRAFSRVPYVDWYSDTDSTLIGWEDLPAFFDFLADLNIHPYLARAIHERLDGDDYGALVDDAFFALQELIQARTGLTSDGGTLMEAALNPNLKPPPIKMNPLTDRNPKHMQMNEQEGVYRICLGLTKSVRNPLTHYGRHSLFAQTRFPDKKTTLKYLAMISLLCERMDKPLP